MTELGRADGFMTHCFDDIFTKPCLQDSGSSERRDLLEMQPTGKIIGGRLLVREISAEVLVQAATILKQRFQGLGSVLCTSGKGVRRLTQVLPACGAMRKPADSFEPHASH